MKKTISLILSLIFVLLQISFPSFAKHQEDGYIFYEDFENYDSDTEAPDGFGWSSIGAGCKVSAKSEKVNGNTALRLTQRDCALTTEL